MNDLVQRLSQGSHPVVASRANHSAEALKQSIDRGYVHIKFTETQGGTELGLRLDPAMTDLNGANFIHGLGKIHLVGNLTLDYVPVRCIADLDLSSLKGDGYLEILET